MKVLLVVYDNDSYIHWFPQGLAYIAAVLKKGGHTVEIYNQDKIHYPEEHLTEYLNSKPFDAVGVGVVGGYFQYRKLLSISRSVKKASRRPIFIIGGHGPSPEPEFFLKKTGADIVVIGEGERTILDVMRAISNKTSLAAVEGIAFRNGDKVKVNKRRPLIDDIDKIPIPAYELFPVDYYRLLRAPNADDTDFVMPVLSGRGCEFSCNFCYRMDEGFRPRSNASIIDEVNYLKKKYAITYINFSDELLMSSVKRTVALCEDFIRAKMNVKWCCNGRLNFAKLDVLKLMKRSGCVFINYGIEAVDDNVLKNMNKALTTDQIIKGIETTKKTGISPGLNVIFGNIGDNSLTLKKDVEFLLKYDDGAQLRTIRPVTPYPGSPLYYYAIEKGSLKDCEDFYENKHINSDLLSVNFTDLADDEFHRCLFEANSILIESYFKKKQACAIDRLHALYMKKDIKFRGFRHT